MESKLRSLIADSIEDFVRLSEVIGGEVNKTVVATAGDGKQALEQLRHRSPMCCSWPWSSPSWTASACSSSCLIPEPSPRWWSPAHL
jgi:hypothetical protein